MVVPRSSSMSVSGQNMGVSNVMGIVSTQADYCKNKTQERELEIYALR